MTPNTRPAGEPMFEELITGADSWLDGTTFEQVPGVSGLSFVSRIMVALLGAAVGSFDGFLWMFWGFFLGLLSNVVDVGALQGVVTV